jgi:hypothetical protein
MNVREIEVAIAQLNSSERAELTEWFAEYRASKWDEQIEQDARLGKLDHLVVRAEADFAAGRCRKL